MPPPTHTRVPLAVLVALTASVASPGADLTWSGGNLSWDATDADSFNATFQAGDNVTFGNTGVGAITVASGVSPGAVEFTHSTGTYSFSGTAWNAGSNALSVSGGGTVLFGNGTNTAFAPTWSGGTTISGGGTLNFTRGPGFIGSSGSTVSLNNGTLKVSHDASSNITYNNALSVLSGGGTLAAVYTGNQSGLIFSGNVGGSGNLTLRSEAGTAGNYANAGLVLSGSNNSGYTGAATLVSNNNLNAPAAAGIRPTGATWFASAASLLTNASSVTVRNGGILGVEFGVTDSNLANVVVGPRGGIAARGTGGNLSSLANVQNYLGDGGFLVLDNFSAVANRLNDTGALTLDNNRMEIIGRNVQTAATNEVIGALTLSGSNHLFLNRRQTNSGITLTAASLANPAAGASLLIETGASDFGTTTATNTLAVTGTKPTATNGMITPAIQHFSGANTLGTFVNWDGTDPTKLVAATYTAYAGDFSAATPGQIVDYTAGTATTLGGTGTLSVHALRVNSAGDLNLGGRTVSLGSGGLIMNRRTVSNGTIDFGSGHGYIGAYDGANQGTISAALAGSAGVTVLGASQSLHLSNTANTFSGGLFVNGGTVTLVGTSANGNDVRVNAFGRLTGPNANSSFTVGGLSGSGRLGGFFQGNNTTSNSAVISPASGTHTFDGSISNGDAGRVFSITKSGAGTQAFGVNSIGTYTGNTSVTDGALLINGNFAAATGNVTVSGGILGGSGTIGGATTIGALGTLAPGSSPGILTFTNGLTVNGTYSWELAALSTGGAGTNFDQVALTGGNGEFNGATFSMSFAPGLAPSLSADAFWNTSRSWIVLNNTGSGSVSGTFSAINNTAWSSKGSFALAFVDDNNDLSTVGDNVVLTWTAIPEPSAFTLLAGLGALALTASRRRSRS